MSEQNFKTTGDELGERERVRVEFNRNQIRVASRTRLLENLEAACRAWALVHASWKAKKTTTGAVISMEYGIRQRLEELDAYDKRERLSQDAAKKPEGPAV